MALHGGKSAMSALIDFFAVRPVYTLYGLRVLWGAYIISQAIPILAVVNRTGLSMAALPAIFILVLQAALNVAVFRLAIEVAAAILLGSPRPQVVGFAGSE
jgi:hypothetical protein